MSRLKDRHLKLARSFRHNSRTLERYPTPTAAMDYYVPYLEDEMGKDLVLKSTSHLKLSKMTTTYYRQVRLGSGWIDLNIEQKAYILVHEAVHARQWEYYGPLKFGNRYVFWPRWRWAIEVQGYREGIMWGVVVLSARGVDKVETESLLKRKIDQVIESLLGKYALGTVNKSDIRKHTRKILEEGIQWQYRRLSCA